MALFEKVVEPTGGGDLLGEESHWVGVALQLSTAVLLPSQSLIHECRLHVTSQLLPPASLPAALGFCLPHHDVFPWNCKPK